MGTVVVVVGAGVVAAVSSVLMKVSTLSSGLGPSPKP